MDPGYYCGAAVYDNMPDEGFDRRRDALEWGLLDKALQREVPVLGICRGLQLINCFLGGGLLQDAGSPGNDIHRSFQQQGTQYDRAHGLNVEDGSLLATITHSRRGVVNSAHHQRIQGLGEGLRASAISDDGVVESIEWMEPSGKPFFMAVQWHPERMLEMGLADSPFSKLIREQFIQAVKSSL